MKLITAYKIIKSLNIPIFRTNDIAIQLQTSNKYGYEILNQLAAENLVLHLRREIWALKDSVDPLMVPDYLTAPLPSYISLQTALYYHGIISQVPSVIYAVSIAKTRRYTTPLATYSIHHIQPDLFSGFEVIGDQAIHLATPEKALFDFFYFKSVKNKLFFALPEVEIAKNFAWETIKQYIVKIRNPARRSMVEKSVAAIYAKF